MCESRLDPELEGKIYEVIIETIKILEYGLKIRY